MSEHDFLNEKEAYLFNSGKLQRSYSRFGAQVLPEGVHFAVWAPHAKGVRVIGDFNEWNGESSEMSPLGKGQTGVWTLFVPGLKQGERYKYEVVAKDGSVGHKADPFAFFSELRPDTASVTYSLEGYNWSKAALAWDKRKRQDAEPMLIYEVHFGSWMRHADGTFYSYRDLADRLVPYVQKMGYTHLEIMPLMEHPLDASWGYQITGYYSATSRFGTPHDLMYFVDKCHQAKIGVILDWVPGHFCRDKHGLGRFDGKALYEGGDHANWGTYRFNFNKAEVWSFLISNALFWFDKYKVDGLRVDGVTSMLYSNFGRADSAKKILIDEQAIDFMRTLNETVATAYPNSLMFAEESTDWPKVTHPIKEEGLGFNYKWNMGWMNDTLKYMEQPFSKRPQYHDCLTFSIMYASSESFILPLSHDEVVHGKKSLLGRMPGEYWQQFAGLKALYCYYLTHPGKMICFMGTELAPFIEWRYYEELEWFLLDYPPHQQFQDFVAEANKMYQSEEALWTDDSGWHGFDWVDADNRSQSVYCFLRYGKTAEDHLLVVLNMTPTHYPTFRVGVPDAISMCTEEVEVIKKVKKADSKKVNKEDSKKDNKADTKKNSKADIKKDSKADIEKEIEIIEKEYIEVFKPTHDYVPLLNSDEECFGGTGKGNTSTIEVEPVAWHKRAASIAIDVPPLAGLILKPVPRK